jgi:hypothetical protein
MPGIVWSPPAEASDLYGFLFGVAVPEDKVVALCGWHLPEQAEGFGQRTGIIEQGVRNHEEKWGACGLQGLPLAEASPISDRTTPASFRPQCAQMNRAKVGLM